MVASSINQRRAMLVLLVLSGVIISICMGLRQSLGLFMRPMTVGLGISAATFGFSIALQNIVWGVSQPFVGALADRYGPRQVLIATALMYAAGLVLMIYANAVSAGLQVAGFLTGIGIAGTGFGVLIGAVSRAAPPHRRTQTVGIVAAAGSLGTMVIAPAAQGLIARFDWKVAMFAAAAVAASMALMSLPIRDQSPAQRGAREANPSVGRAVQQALEHRGYLFMTVAFFACGFQLVFITSYLPSYLQICGVAPGVGASALALIGLFNAIGTYVFGLLGARYSQKHLLALVYLLRTLAIIAFLVLPISPTTVLIFAAAMGFLWLSVAPLVSGLVGRLFGLKHFSTLYGFVFLSHQIGSFCGVLLGGIAFDLTGSYATAWAGLIGIGLLAFALQWRMDDRASRPSARGLAAIGQVVGA
jgi:predicted MFS family arabinose efflux permease